MLERQAFFLLGREEGEGEEGGVRAVGDDDVENTTVPLGKTAFGWLCGPILWTHGLPEGQTARKSS